ncbi:MAG: GatB/YqeY domain-containing protein [Gammaproteobacteria bacterium]
MTSLKAKLQNDIKDAMRAKEPQLLGTLRFISAAIKQREVDERIELTDTQVIEVLTKMAKQRREAIEQFKTAGRTDLSDKETAELKIIESFLPQPLDPAELDGLIARVIDEQAATSIKDMAKVMAALKPLVQGRADMSQVSQKIKDRLA